MRQEEADEQEPPKVYYQGRFGCFLISPTMLLDAGWTIVDGVWIAPPNLLEETQE